MNHRGTRTKDKPPITSDESLGWIDEVFNQFIDRKWAYSIPNVYSLVTIASLKINTFIKNEDGVGGKEDAVKKNKTQLVHTVLERVAQYSSKADLTQTKKHLDEIKSSYRALGFPILDLEAKLTNRGIVGASSSFGKSVFEVGLSFHPILNVPYIHGSSIKGAIRAACTVKKIFPDKLVKELFGNDAVGRLDFSDAYPVEKGVKGYIIIPDVLTPTYSKGGEDVLKENEAMPTPVLFPSIAPNTIFRFLMADRAQKAEQQLMENLLKAVIVAFSLGIGAKTSLGYGTFELVRASVEAGG